MGKHRRPHIFSPITAGCLMICFCLKVSAQSPMDCDKLLKREITADSVQFMINNIMRADCFGLDSIDLKVFGNGPVLGSILVKLISNNNAKVTYADLLTQINNAKKDTGYLSIRKVIIAQNMLEATIASASTWEKSKDMLAQIGTTAIEIENLHQFMLQNQDKNWNYRQLVVIYNEREKNSKTSTNEKADTSDINAVKNLRSVYSKYCDTSKLIKFGENQIAFSDYLCGLECGKKMHKACLIFFNAHYSVNSRGLESLMVYNPQINSYLRENYIVVSLMVDDRAMLPNSTKTIGEVNSDLETEKFKANYQPFIVIIDQNGNIKRSMGSTDDSTILLHFLTKQD